MAHSKCPQCNDYGFSWYVDADPPNLTLWSCHSCGYSATEDESYEQKCPCGKVLQIQLHDDPEAEGNNLFGYEQTVIRLTDKAGTYWWCGHCVKKFPYFSR
jgi:hypothetical protein